MAFKNQNLSIHSERFFVFNSEKEIFEVKY